GNRRVCATRGRGASARRALGGVVAHVTGSAVTERLSVGEVELEVLRRGSGRPVLLLHGLQTVDPRARFLDLLGRTAEIIAPSPPGFGFSPRPADFETV